MSAATLYQELGAPIAVSEIGRGRTERTANTPDTIDNDRLVTDLYGALGIPVAGGGDHGRTAITRAPGETVDRDAMLPAGSSQLEAATDLYEAIATVRRPRRTAGAETAITAASETVDYDRPPELPHT